MRLVVNGISALDASEIEKAVRAPADRPIELQALSTSDLPAAGDFPYGLVYDITAGSPKFSNGSAWSLLGPSSAAELAFTPSGNISSTNVQSALAEVDLEKAPKAGPSFTGVVSVSELASSGKITTTGGTSTFNSSGGIRVTGDYWSAWTGAGLELRSNAAGQSYIMDYNRTSAAYGTLNLYGSSIKLWEGGVAQRLEVNSSGVTVSHNFIVNSGGTISCAGDITSTGGKIGYATGAGGTVTQATSKSTAVTLNKSCGRVTMHNAALANGARVTFRINNSTIAAGDSAIVSISGGMVGTNYYQCGIARCAAGMLDIWIQNVSGASQSEAIEITFIVMKGVTA